MPEEEGTGLEQRCLGPVPLPPGAVSLISEHCGVWRRHSGRRATSTAPFHIHTKPQGGLGPCLAVAATVRAYTTLTSVVSSVKLDGNTTLTRPWEE